MNEQRRPFRYTAEPLLRAQVWEAQHMAADGVRARRIADEQQARLRETQTRIAAVVEALRALYTAPEGISLERRALLQTYLEHQHGIEALQRQEVTQAEARHAQIMEQLRAKRIAIKIMEKHRERKHSAHEQEDLRRGFKAADDSWLLRRGGGRG